MQTCNHGNMVGAGIILIILQFKPNKASADDVNRHVMSRMNEKVAAMKQPEERARDYLALSQFTIILSVVCAFFPYNFLCLIAVFMLSKMVCALCVMLLQQFIFSCRW